MITFVKGDLFSSNAQALVNTVNTVGIMGKGVALAFRRAFPHNFRVYKQACGKGQIEIGRVLAVSEENPLMGRHIIINLPTKTHWRLPSQYIYVEKGLHALKSYLLQNPELTVAMPAPGCGNGGLEWAKVKRMIAEILSELPNDITVYEPI